MFRRFASLAAMLTAVLLAGCGGGGGSGTVAASGAGMPSGLQYAQANVQYPVNEPIIPNQPSSTGAAITHYDVSPALPAGLQLDPTSGVISGTPTSESHATPYTVTGSNAAGSIQTMVTIAVVAVQTAPAALRYDQQSPTYTAGMPIKPNEPNPVGGEVTRYSIDPSGDSLPLGLSLSETTGVISGTPILVPLDFDTAAARTYDVTVVGSNGVGSAKEKLAITIEPEVVPPAAPENLHYTVSWAAYAAGKAIATNVAHYDGGAITGYSVLPALPEGLTLDPSTGDISGVPAAASPSTTYTVTGVNESGSASAQITLQVVPPGTWVPTRSVMHSVRYEAVQITLLDGRVLVAGGKDATGMLASAELYDPGTGEWTETSPMATSRYGAMSALLPTGKVLVAGGFDSTGTVLRSAEIFDPNDPSAPWQSTGSMNSARTGAGIALLANGNVVVAGGVGNGSPGPVLSTVEIYDAGTGTWTSVRRLNAAATDIGALSMQGGTQIVVPGAQNAFGAVLNQVQVSDQAISNWTNSTFAGPARLQYAALAMTDQYGLVFGGVNGSTFNAVDLYNAASKSSSSVTPLSVPRGRALVAPLDATHVLVAGGTNNGIGINSAEVYTFNPNPPLGMPATATAPTSPMSVVRIAAGISALQDGHVLVSGGWDNTQSQAIYTNTSEIYVP